MDKMTNLNNNSCFFSLYFPVLDLITETRLRSADRLLCGLRAEDAIDNARSLGFDYPVSQADAIDATLAALSEIQNFDNDTSAEEETLMYEWDEEQGEEFEGCIHVQADKINMNTNNNKHSQI